MHRDAINDYIAYMNQFIGPEDIGHIMSRG